MPSSSGMKIPPGCRLRNSLRWLPSIALVGGAIFVAWRNLAGHVHPVFHELPPALSDSLAVLLGVGLLLLVGAARVGKAGAGSPVPLRFWLAGAGLSLLACLTMVWGVNPHGHFGSAFFQPMVLSARGEKLRAYTALSLPPQLVVMGSSNTFTISPGYLQEQLGYRSFNFGVEAGQIEDALLQARFIYRLHAVAAPSVMLVEVTEPLAGGELTAAERVSVTQWIDMDPRTLLLTIEQQTHETLNYQTLADAAFVLLYYVQGKAPRNDWTFLPDGEGVYTPGYSITDAIVASSLKRDIREAVPAACQKLDTTGEAKVYQLIALAESRGTALVFYRSPVHPDYYQSVLANNPGFQACHAQLVVFMQSLPQQYSHVFFVDFLQVDSLNALGNRGFIDSHHLSALGAQHLVDALAPVLREAGRRATAEGTSQP
jgi:hypothetical protein